MAKSVADFEREFLSGLEESTGKDLKAWMKRCEQSGETKHNALLKHLKTKHGFNHMQANILVTVYKNGGKPVYGDTSGLMDAHFNGKEEIRPLYVGLEKKVRSVFKGVNVVPTKGYISFRNEREFAVAKVTSRALRVGMDLGERPFEGRVEKAKSLGTMPRISHMVELTKAADVDAEVIQLLKEAHQRVNG